MTAIAPARLGALLPGVSRVANVMRLHVANPWPTVLLPWIVLFAVHGLNWAIWAIVTANAGDGLQPGAFHNTGGVAWLVVYMMVLAIQAMNSGFRFALGFSATRRDYYLGTVGFFALMAIVYSVGIGLLALAERATDGWGVDGAFYAPGYLYDEPFAVIVFHFIALYLLFVAMGALIGALFVRWKAYGLYLYFGGLSLVILALVWWMVRGGWASATSFLTDNPLAVVMAWTLPVSVVLAGLGFVVIRRAPSR